ncbi:MAG: hypothetical protein LBL15_08250 [Oscillospiraceae bacterium]|jgi:site-specific recombinase XerD|nr:hypothetical protein [Oscillospiraceae bacterium]
MKDKQEPGPIERYASLLRARGRAESAVRRRTQLLWHVAEALGGETRLLTAEDKEIQRAVSARISNRKDVLISWYTDVSAFMDYLVQEGLRKDNPLTRGTASAFPEGVTGIRKRRNKMMLRDMPEFVRLRDSTILTLLRETDIRPAELQALTAGCYERKQAQLEPAPGRRVLLNGFAAERLAEYLEALRAYARPDDSAPLFIDADSGSPLPNGHYWRLIRGDLRLASASLPEAYTAAEKQTVEFKKERYE